MRGNDAAAGRAPSDATGLVNILVVGIPTAPLMGMIRSRHPGKLNLYVAECRPYEMQVAGAVAAIARTSVAVSIVTDNMLAALIETVPIQAVWTQYLEIDGEHAAAINGAHLAALLARMYGIPCLLYPIPDLPPGEAGRFAGEDIAVLGAAYIAWERDVVPLDLVDEVIQLGSESS